MIWENLKKSPPGARWGPKTTAAWTIRYDENQDAFHLEPAKQAKKGFPKWTDINQVQLVIRASTTKVRGSLRPRDITDQFVVKPGSQNINIRHPPLLTKVLKHLRVKKLLWYLDVDDWSPLTDFPSPNCAWRTGLEHDSAQERTKSTSGSGNDGLESVAAICITHV